MLAYLFVYGTLRRAANHPMGRWLAERASFAGVATVHGRLYQLGPYTGMRISTEPREVVRGELYLLNDPFPTFQTLDEYEGEEFERVQVQAMVLSQEAIECWVYVYRGHPPEQNRVSSTDFLET